MKKFVLHVRPWIPVMLLGMLQYAIVLVMLRGALLYQWKETIIVPMYVVSVGVALFGLRTMPKRHGEDLEQIKNEWSTHE